MARVDFYVVGSGGAVGAARVACKVAEKAWRRGLRVYVCAATEVEAGRMDELLWTFRQDSFVPHALAGETGAQDEAILIGCGVAAGDGREMLVNLGVELPEALPAFERIAEVVSDDDETRRKARERFARYRRLGHELNTHDVQP